MRQAVSAGGELTKLVRVDTSHRQSGREQGTDDTTLESYPERRGSAFHRTFLREAAKPIRCFQGQILLMECPLSRTDQRWKCPFIWGEAVMPTSRSK
jgi:hypothetical protein